MEKNALITGGSRGIGLGIAKSLAREGYQLAINGIRDEKQVEPVIEELKNTGIKVIYCRGDIGKPAGRESILHQVKKNFNHLNILVNNAGMAPRERKDILEASEESFEEVMHVNLMGPYFLTQSIVKWMIAEKKAAPDYHACIITISSVSSTIGSVNRGEYCISKAGLSMMTKLYAARLGEYNIPVYEIQPGIVNSDMTSAVKEKYDRMIENGLLVQKRWGLPSDVGKAVVMLARDDLSYSTGQVIMIDGGMSIGRL